MRTAYVTEPGAVIHRDGPVLRVYAGRRLRTELLVHDLDQLVLVGNVILTPAVLDFLIESRVDTVFLSLYGRYRGRLLHEHSKNVLLRVRQYARLTDEAFSLDLARTVVRGKIVNARTFLLRCARRGKGDTRVAAAAERLAAIIERLAGATTRDAVRGFEGRAAAIYFEVFGLLLDHPDFAFSVRSRRPPLDPPNVLLSLGYTLLTNAVETAVQIVGLDPYLGALHERAYGRPSLVCDLVEEFRAVVVDPMVVAAVNRRAFSRADFEEPGDGTPIRFERKALKWFVTLFERRIRTAVIYPPAGVRLDFRDVIERQVRHMARVLMGTDPSYEPFRAR